MLLHSLIGTQSFRRVHADNVGGQINNYHNENINVAQIPVRRDYARTHIYTGTRTHEYSGFTQLNLQPT